MDSLYPQAYGFFLLLLRTVGLAITLPGVGARVVPARIRLAFALAVTVPVFIGAGSPSPALPSSFLALSGAAISETLVGLAAGYACLLAVEAAMIGGQLTSVSMGLSYGTIIDPMNGSQSSAISGILSQLTIFTALACGLHREAIAWLCRQAIETPPGSIASLQPLALATVTGSINSIALGYRLAFPFLAATNVAHMAFGMMNKAAPQLNLNSLGFSVSILIGGGALYLAAPMAADYAAQAAIAAFTRS